ncbi:MAG: ribose-phosphate pyrophosphokinase [Firmicutes bacterium]|nr:ribose-phosphate pyrophosphokinase [Bacillota bacterium]
MLNELKIFSGRAHPELAREICSVLQVEIGRSEIIKFTNDNSFVRIYESVREADVYVVQPSCEPVNDGIVELLIMVDALRRASVKRITAVLPYFPYGRSDKKDQPRISITARLMADLLEVAGVDRVLSVDLHAPQIQGFFKIPVDHLTAIPIFAAYFQEKNLSDLVIVAPDAGRAKMARQYARRLNCPMAIIDKRRVANEEKVVMESVMGDVEGKRCLLVDDEISSGASIVAAANTLEKFGAAEIYAAITHPILSGMAPQRIASSPIKELVVTNSVPVPEEKRNGKIKVLSIAPLLGEAIWCIHNGVSVSKVFEKE